MTDAFARALKGHYHRHEVSWRDLSAAVVYCDCGASATAKEAALQPNLWPECKPWNPWTPLPPEPQAHEHCLFCGKRIADPALFAQHVLECGR